MNRPYCPTCGHAFAARYPRDPEFYHKLAMDPRTMSVDIVELQRMDYALQQRIDRSILDRSSIKERVLADCQRHMVIEMRLAIYGKAHPEAHIIRYPSDWWQSVKERFAPAWFRDRYPVKFTEHTASLKELYPDVTPALPDRGPVMRFQVHKREVANCDW